MSTHHAEPVSDAALIAASLTDADAFREIYDRYAAAVHAFATRRCTDPDLALDVTAETFCQAWRGRHSFRDDRGGSAGPWLFGIARHVLARAARERRLRAEAMAALGVVQRSTGVIPDPGDLLQGLEEDLQSALDALPPTQRTAIELRVLQDRGYDDVADRLGTSPTAARIRVHRGLAAMRLRLDLPQEKS